MIRWCIIFLSPSRLVSECLKTIWRLSHPVSLYFVTSRVLAGFCVPHSHYMLVYIGLALSTSTKCLHRFLFETEPVFSLVWSRDIWHARYKQTSFDTLFRKTYMPDPCVRSCNYLLSSLRSITFFNQKHAVYENFANMVEPKGPQMTP